MNSHWLKDKKLPHWLWLCSIFWRLWVYNRWILTIIVSLERKILYRELEIFWYSYFDFFPCLSRTNKGIKSTWRGSPWWPGNHIVTVYQLKDAVDVEAGEGSRFIILDILCSKTLQTETTQWNPSTLTKTSRVPWTLQDQSTIKVDLNHMLGSFCVSHQQYDVVVRDWSSFTWLHFVSMILPLWRHPDPRPSQWQRNQTQFLFLQIHHLLCSQTDCDFWMSTLIKSTYVI